MKRVLADLFTQSFGLLSGCPTNLHIIEILVNLEHGYCHGSIHSKRAPIGIANNTQFILFASLCLIWLVLNMNVCVCVCTCTCDVLCCVEWQSAYLFLFLPAVSRLPHSAYTPRHSPDIPNSNVFFFFGWQQPKRVICAPIVVRCFFLFLLL